MSILKTKCFSGLGYINPKGKDRKIKKLERTYIKGKRGVKLYYDSAHYDEYEIDDDYVKNKLDNTDLYIYNKKIYIDIKDNDVINIIEYTKNILFGDIVLKITNSTSKIK